MVMSAVNTVLFIHVPTEWRTTNRRHAFLALAETLPPNVAVVCVNRAVDPVVTLLKRPRKFFAGVWRTRDERVTDRLRVVTPRLILHEILAAKVPGATAVNRLLMRWQLRRTMSRWFPEAERVIQWIHHPVQHWLFGVFPDSGKVYHCYDEYTCSPDGSFHPVRWERERPLLRDADVTFATSNSLLQRRHAEARRSHLLPNGAPEFFLRSHKTLPETLRSIPAPRLVYVGSMYSFLDYDLLERIFTRRTDWQLVFLGTRNPSDAGRLLRAAPNVHFIGRLDQESLPAFLAHFDVGLMPFKINAYSLPATPLKLYEYMAAGLPVVSTDLPNLQRFRTLIRLVPDDADAFERAIAETLASDRQQESAKLRAEAKKHTWLAINRVHVVPVLQDVFGF